MALMRRKSFQQLQRIMSDIRKAGGDISDVKNFGDHNTPNTIWINNPIDGDMDNIDDHMKIDIPDEHIEIKKEDLGLIFNFDGFEVSENYLVWQEKSQELKTLQDYPNFKSTAYGKSASITYLGKEVVIKGESGNIVRVKKDGIDVSMHNSGKEEFFKFKEILKSYKVDKKEEDKETKESEVAGLDPTEVAKSKTKDSIKDSLKNAKEDKSLETDYIDKKKTKKTKVADEVTVVDDKKLHNTKEIKKNYKLERFKK